MPVTSLSIDEETLEKLKEMEKKVEGANRSKLVRLALESFRQELELDEIQGKYCNAVLTVIYESHEADGLKGVVEKFEDLIKTEIHQHSQGVCVRVLIVGGETLKLKEMLRVLRGKKGLRSLSVNVIS